MFDSANRHLFSFVVLEPRSLVSVLVPVTDLACGGLDPTGQCDTNGTLLAGYHISVQRLHRSPSGCQGTLCTRSCPAGLGNSLSVTEWYNTALSKEMCVCGPIRISEEKSIASNSHILFGLLPCLSVSIFMSQSAFILHLLRSLTSFLVFFTSSFMLALSHRLSPYLFISPSFCSIVHRLPCLFTPTLSPAVILSLLLSDFLFVKAVSMVG